MVQRPRIFPGHGVLSPLRLEGCAVWTEGIHTENPNSVLQEFRCHVLGEVWVAAVGIGRPRKPSVPAGSNQEDLVSSSGFLPRILLSVPIRP